MASAMAFIDATALNVVLPSLQKDLQIEGGDLFWILNSYLVMLSASIIVGGSLGDSLGRVKVFKWGIIIFIISSILCGLSPNVQSLIGFRLIQGIGGALMIPGSLSILSSLFADKDKGKAIGSWSASTIIFAMGGPIIGGALGDAGLWRFIFYINVPLGLLALVILISKVPESRSSKPQKVDWAGAVSLTLALASLTFGFLSAPEVGWNHLSSIGALIVGAVMIVVFLIVESKVDQPMMPLSVFNNKCFSGVNLLTFFLYAALGGFMLFISLNMVQIQGYTQFQAGLTFLPFTFMMAALARPIGSLSDRWGTRNFLIVGPAITGIGFYLLSQVGVTSGPSDFWSTFFPGIFGFSLGMSITVVPLTTTVMRSLKDDQAGIASGVNNSITRIAGTLANALMGALSIRLFTSKVESGTERLSLSQEAKDLVVGLSSKFGEAKAPDVFSDRLGAQINELFQLSFIDAYQAMGLLAAALSFAASFFAILMIRDYKGSA